MDLIKCHVTSFIQPFGLAQNNKAGNNGTLGGRNDREWCELEGHIGDTPDSGVQEGKEGCPGGFQMPLRYPGYKKEDYESMEDWRLDMLLKGYGLSLSLPLMRKGHLLWAHSCGLIKCEPDCLY